MKPESNRPITIEDLLRLKCAERPPAEFWTDFDRKLRAKQLAALVDKRPWWQTLPRFSFGLLRYRIAVGACAIGALSILAVREYRGTSPVSRVAISEVRATVASDPRPEASASGFAENGFSTQAVATFATVGSQQESSLAITEPAVDAVVPMVHTRLVALPDPSVVQSDVESQSSSALSASTLASSDLMPARRFLGNATGFEARVMPARMAVEPLQQMTPPSDTRRNRILTAKVSTASLEASAETSERAANRITSEERLYDQIHRFSARGAGLQVKF